MQLLSLKATVLDQTQYEWKFRGGVGPYRKSFICVGSAQELSVLKTVCSCLFEEQFSPDVLELSCEVSDDAGDIWTISRKQGRTIFSKNGSRFAEAKGVRDLISEICSVGSEIKLLDSGPLCRHFEVIPEGEGVRVSLVSNSLGVDEKIVQRWIKNKIQGLCASWLQSNESLLVQSILQSYSPQKTVDLLKTIYHEYQMCSESLGSLSDTTDPELDLNSFEKLSEEISLLSRMEDLLWFIQNLSRSCLSPEEKKAFNEKYRRLENVMARKESDYSHMGWYDFLINAFEVKMKSDARSYLHKLESSVQDKVVSICKSQSSPFQALFSTERSFQVLENGKNIFRKELELAKNKIELEKEKSSKWSHGISSFLQRWGHGQADRDLKISNEKMKLENLERAEMTIYDLAVFLRTLKDELQDALSLDSVCLPDPLGGDQGDFEEKKKRLAEDLLDFNVSPDLSVKELFDLSIVGIEAATAAKILSQNDLLRSQLRQKSRELEGLLVLWQKQTGSQKKIQNQNLTALFGEAKNLVRYKNEKLGMLRQLSQKLSSSLARQELRSIFSKKIQEYSLAWTKVWREISSAEPSLSDVRMKDFLKDMEEATGLISLHQGLGLSSSQSFLVDDGSALSTWGLFLSYPQGSKNVFLKMFEQSSQPSSGCHIFLTLDEALSPSLKALGFGEVDKANRDRSIPRAQSVSGLEKRGLGKGAGSGNLPLRDSVGMGRADRRVQTIVDLLNGHK
ncbi:MAG: hypothetical protein KA436_05025 [Oligoflexales bacterium]|nr:hypothetical protein [Oligoflexales bacterium]